MFVDSHCHLEMESFDKDRKEVIENSFAEGIVCMLTVGTEEKYFKKVIEIIDQYPYIYGSIGIHPHNSKNYNERIAEKIKNYITHDKVVAYGEIGLDFFKNYSPKDSQMNAFIEQVWIAQKERLPIIVHSRNAKEETIDILEKHNNNGMGGVIHCFSYDLPTAKKLLDLGYYISIPGTITYHNTHKLAEVVKYIPNDRILAETDAPFLTPYPHRGRRNEPRFVKLTIDRIAKIKSHPVEEVASSIYSNFIRVFLKNQRSYR